MLMVPVCPESGFLGRSTWLRPASKGGCGQLETDYSIGESEQEVEMTVGIMGFDFRQAPSRGSVG
jgi:hypothetical protein